MSSDTRDILAQAIAANDSYADDAAEPTMVCVFRDASGNTSITSTPITHEVNHTGGQPRQWGARIYWPAPVRVRHITCRQHVLLIEGCLTVGCPSFENDEICNLASFVAGSPGVAAFSYDAPYDNRYDVPQLQSPAGGVTVMIALAASGFGEHVLTHPALHGLGGLEVARQLAERLARMNQATDGTVNLQAGALYKPRSALAAAFAGEVGAATAAAADAKTASYIDAVTRADATRAEDARTFGVAGPAMATAAKKTLLSAGAPAPKAEKAAEVAASLSSSIATANEALTALRPGAAARLARHMTSWAYHSGVSMETLSPDVICLCFLADEHAMQAAEAGNGYLQYLNTNEMAAFMEAQSNQALSLGARALLTYAGATASIIKEGEWQQLGRSVVADEAVFFGDLYKRAGAGTAARKIICMLSAAMDINGVFMAIRRGSTAIGPRKAASHRLYTWEEAGEWMMSLDGDSTLTGANGEATRRGERMGLTSRPGLLRCCIVNEASLSDVCARESDLATLKASPQFAAAFKLRGDIFGH